MPSLNPDDFARNAKVFEKNCLYCGVTYYASRSTAKFCCSTCRGYYNQAKNSEEMVPYQETERMISALLSENAYLKGQVQRYLLENQQLKQIMESAQTSKTNDEV